MSTGRPTVATEYVGPAGEANQSPIASVSRLRLACKVGGPGEVKTSGYERPRAAESHGACRPIEITFTQANLPVDRASTVGQRPPLH